MKKILLVALVLVAVVVVWQSMGSDKTQNSSTNTPAANSNSTNNSTNTADTNEDAGNVVSGTLMASNSTAKGNLMLVTETQTIYIRTSRDFSGLVGKEVNVSFDGDLTNFTLVDIQAK